MLRMKCSMLLLFALFTVSVNAENIDPEVYMEVPEIIEHWGYPQEVHKVQTLDGYILTMHRIPNGKSGKSAAVGAGTSKPVVFLQHGLEACSSNWITNLPEYAFGFVLADAGFDVWMGNVRGNLYGKEHLYLNVSEHPFWEFSFDEMIKYDLDAMINYALSKANQKSLYYVGHSQGTLIMFSKLAVQPEFGAKVRQFHALAPVGTVQYIEGILRFIADDLFIVDEIFFDLFGRNEFLPENGAIHAFQQKFCEGMLDERLCGDFLFALCGPETKNMNESRIPVFLVDEPSGTSSMNMMHWIQLVRSGKQQMYDYGKKGNQNHYSQDTPPVYPIENIKTDMYLYWSRDDWLADAKDIEGYLLPTLPKDYTKQSNELQHYNHLDFIWGNRARKEIYDPIIQLINEDLKKI